MLFTQLRRTCTKNFLKKKLRDKYLTMALSLEISFDRCAIARNRRTTSRLLRALCIRVNKATGITKGGEKGLPTISGTGGRGSAR